MRVSAILRQLTSPGSPPRQAVAGASLPQARGAPRSTSCLCSMGCGPTPSRLRKRRTCGGCARRVSPSPTVIRVSDVTRVNATAIGTGTLPGATASSAIPNMSARVDPNHAFVNDDHKKLLRLDEVTRGGMVLVKTLGEILQERGKRLAAVSSGSTGSALLTNARARRAPACSSTVIGNRACASRSRMR